MEAAVIQLLNRLEEIGRTHEELYDTDVREQTGRWFMELFFNGHVGLPPPAEYGMFSENGNAAVQAAFIEFAERLRESSSFVLLPEAEKWRIFKEVTTAVTGEPVEAFFGTLEPSSFVAPEIRQHRARHWLQQAYVYPLFLVFPGILIFLIAFFAFPALVKGSFSFLVFIVVVGTISLVIGDSIWQFLSNRTYRRQYDNVA